MPVHYKHLEYKTLYGYLRWVLFPWQVLIKLSLWHLEQEWLLEDTTTGVFVMARKPANP